MTLIVRFGPDDAARCRFAVSPLQETMSALLTLQRPRRHAFYLPWLQTARRTVDTTDLTLILAATSTDYGPDFLWPSPADPIAAMDAELAAVAATDPATVAGELADLAGRLDRRAVPAEVRRLLTGDPVVARDLLVAQQRSAWRTLVEPLWERIRGLADADITARSRRLAAAGLEGLLTDLHPRTVWHGDALHLTGFATGSHDLRGRGLVLVPTAFGWPGLGIGHSGDAATATPALTYPMLGAARLWETVAHPPTIARLLGRGRAAVLAEAVVPGTTTGLARRVALSPATVSQHLAVLREAGLVTSERRGREVLHEQTALGAALLNGATTTAGSCRKATFPPDGGGKVAFLPRSTS